MVSDKPAIQTDSLSRQFGDLTAVNSLSIEVNQGEVYGFLGHNGAGKTTTIRLLNGVLAPTSGGCKVLGLDPVLDGPALRKQTGVLTENPSLDERMSGRENLHFYANLYGVPKGNVKKRVDQLLGDFDLLDRADEKVGGYSKGMKQRLALARPLLHNPEIIFLDEPTSGLDPVAAVHVRHLITRLSTEEGCTVFLCTHNLIEAQRLCHRVAVLEHGKLIAEGTPAELTSRFSHRQQLGIEVHNDDISRAVTVLQKMNSIQVLNHENGNINITGASRERVPEIISTLSGKDIRIYRVTAEEPSLEEVYLALHGEEDKP
jgi:ABC-2 type transport system ATP-binding protein